MSLTDEVGVWFEAASTSSAARGQTLESRVAPGLRVLADRSALEQVLENLLVNACKYSPEGSVIVVTAEAQGDQVRLEVLDDGPGVPEALRGRLFERFFRVDPGRSRDMGGTGLGLAIVKHLVEAMGGRVGMVGRAPRGSAFWVTLPRSS